MSSRPELPGGAKDAFYTAVGFAVLATQRFQVRRRELRKQVQPVVKSAAATTAERLDTGRQEFQKQMEPKVREAANRLRQAAVALDKRVDPVLDKVERSLPDNGGSMVRQARAVAKDARDAVLDRAAGAKDQPTTER